MQEGDSLGWARQNKSEVVHDILQGFERSPFESPSAIFMAGLPGAGKTELARGLLSVTSSKVLLIDMDEIAQRIPGYQAECADKFRAGATVILERVFDKAIDKKLEFILDGTFGGAKALANVERALRHGYIVKILYIYQKPEVAWKYTKARELVEHRAIDLNGFVETYFRLRDNLHRLTPLIEKNGDYVSVDLIRKNANNKPSDWQPDMSIVEIDEEVPIEYNKETLRKLLEG